MEPLNCLPSSEDLREATGNIRFIKNGKFLSVFYESGNIFSKLIRTKFPKNLPQKFWKSV